MKKTLVALVVAAVVLGGVGVAWSATSGGGTSSGAAATLDASTTGGRRPALRRSIATLAVKTAADTIHVDQKALVQELRSGKSIADVANEHGVSPATVSDAIVKAAEQKLQTLQSSGKLTADQVQKIEQRLPQAVDKLVNGKLHPKARATLRRRALRGALQTAADTIHVDQKALVQELRSGKSIADVANEHGVSPATVSDAIVKAAEQKLQTLQSSGKLTADQVQKIEQRLPQAVDKLVNAQRGQHAPAAPNGGSPAQQSSLAA